MKVKRRKKTKTEKNKGGKNYSERVSAKWYCCAFKLGFRQLIYKASLIFKLNLELALSIFLNERELYESRCYGGVDMFKNMVLVILFDMFLNPNLEWSKN